MITIGGEAVTLPPELEQQAVTLAEAASVEAGAAVAELEDDPGLTEKERLEGYMSNFYSKAYLDGFFRALSFARHQGKEGRIRRLRDLWSAARVDNPHGSSDVVVRIDGDAYTEFDQLLNLSVTGSDDAQSSANQCPPVQKSTPLVS
ncbi:MAG: hypothetical protein JRJ10_14515 [Deltaproteobacteria bacterium]|nr:hypothetical protein [Deltaproteobacteria bacterium]